MAHPPQQDVSCTAVFSLPRRPQSVPSYTINSVSLTTALSLTTNQSYTMYPSRHCPPQFLYHLPSIHPTQSTGSSRGCKSAHGLHPSPHTDGRKRFRSNRHHTTSCPKTSAVPLGDLSRVSLYLRSLLAPSTGNVICCGFCVLLVAASTRSSLSFEARHGYLLG